jgi:hypothetical protein
MPSPIPTEPERGNILIRAVLGLGVRHTLESHADRIALHPESADAKRLAALRFVRRLAALGTVMSRDVTDSRRSFGAGLSDRTEDTDFFGCGVATWTSASIGSFVTQ